MKDLSILITGGTIGSVWSPEEDTAVVTSSDYVVEYIREYIKPDYDIYSEIITMKDSRSITDNTRKDILTSIKKSKSKNILITHGTYTMSDTAKYIKSKLGNTDKKIVLVGSFYPLKGYCPSDAGFNLGYALGVLENIEPGVYVAMHSKTFSPEEVFKDIEHAKFTIF